MELVHAEPNLAAEASTPQVAELHFQMTNVLMPHAVSHELVKSETKLSGLPAQSLQKLGVQEWLAAGEPDRANAMRMCVFEKADGDVDVEAIGPLNWDAAVRARQVALVCAGE